jgi:hypothetical protein
MLTIGINADSGAGMAGDAPKPESLTLDGPIAQDARGKAIATARPLNRRMWIPGDEHEWTMQMSKIPARAMARQRGIENPVGPVAHKVSLRSGR